MPIRFLSFDSQNEVIGQGYSLCVKYFATILSCILRIIMIR